MGIHAGNVAMLSSACGGSGSGGGGAVSVGTVNEDIQLAGAANAFTNASAATLNFKFYNDTTNKGAFRAGSFSIGLGTIGVCSVATGCETTASGHYSFASGYLAIASGLFSTAMGLNAVASGDQSVGIGDGTTASGDYASALVKGAVASGAGASALGLFATASGDSATALGYNTVASGDYSTTMGYESTSSGDYSLAAGRWVTSTQIDSFIFGKGVSAVSMFTSPGTATFSIGFDKGATDKPDFTVGIGYACLWNANELRFYDTGSSHYVGFKAPALTTNQIWVLPATDGTSGQLLSTNGSGTLSWADDSTLIDSHYTLLAGRVGGQDVSGGIGVGTDDLLLRGNSSNTSDVLLNPVGGNVGVGTESPSVKLEVQPDGGLSIGSCANLAAIVTCANHRLVTGDTVYLATGVAGALETFTVSSITSPTVFVVDSVPTNNVTAVGYTDYSPFGVLSGDSATLLGFSLNHALVGCFNAYSPSTVDQRACIDLNLNHYEEGSSGNRTVGRGLRMTFNVEREDASYNQFRYLDIITNLGEIALWSESEDCGLGVEGKSKGYGGVGVRGKIASHEGSAWTGNYSGAAFSGENINTQCKADVCGYKSAFLGRQNYDRFTYLNYKYSTYASRGMYIWKLGSVPGTGVEYGVDIYFQEGGLTNVGVNVSLVGAKTTNTGMIIDCQNATTNYGLLVNNGLSGFATLTPTSTLHNKGSLGWKQETKTADYTLTSSDNVILADNSTVSTTITMTLPNAVADRIHTIKAIDVTGTVKVDTNDSATIDGAADYTFAAQYDVIQVICDGTDWFIIN